MAVGEEAQVDRHRGTVLQERRSAVGHARVLALGLVCVGLAACSSNGSSSDNASPTQESAAATSVAATTAPSTTAATTTTVLSSSAPTSTAPASTCTQGATQPEVAATPVAGSASDLDVTSFDGTPIRVHWFPAAEEDEPLPTVLMGPGFGSAGNVSLDLQNPSDVSPAIVTLQAAGYNVLTWDPRGVGASGGLVSLNGPDEEGRDMQVILDWVAVQPEVEVDAVGDPRVGMVGYSYGGGIQLTTASIDCRVDAIVPGIAWHSLVSSLYPDDTVKSGWTGLLNLASAAAHRDPRVDQAIAEAATGVLDPAEVDWFASRGVGDGIEHVAIPSLFIQGTVDTLFPLDEAVLNYQSLRARNVPTKLLWYCGGHGICLTNTDDAGRVRAATMAWLARYVQGDTTVDTGPAFDIVDDDGAVWTGDDVPVASSWLEATADEGLDLTGDGGSGPATLPPTVTDPTAGAIAGITASPATNAVTADVVATADALVVGTPMLHLTYFGTTPDPGGAPTRVFAQLVDVQRGVVVGNQLTPIDVVLDGASHTIDQPLEMISQSLAAGDTLQLQLVASSSEYAVPALGGHIEFTSVDVRLPVVSSLIAG
jgi:ABC-2 type transport system ATP-binding protein